MATVYLALGTNLGDRAKHLADARASLPPAVTVLRCSPIYETAPWGYPDQPDFLNQVVSANTELGPEELLAYLKAIERKLGREPTFRNGPRVVDLDILLYDDWVYQSTNLTIPHPRLAERAFVLAPLADLAPELRHPVVGKTMRELAEAVGREGVRRFMKGVRGGMV